MSEMVDDGGVFADSIKRIGNGKTIKKVIFDVRDNIGGSDYAWLHVLQAIMKDTLILRRMLAFKDSELMHHYINGLRDKYEIESIYPKINTLPFLNDLNVICLADTSYFAPDPNSLQYAGKIYILQNLGSFSAAQSITAFSKQIPQLVSVGVPTGNIAGAGFGPWTFQLGESKYTFNIDIDSDITDASNAKDVFQDRPEIEVYPTIDEMIEMNNYGRILNKRGGQFLFNHDYLFKKVVEME
ncbi:MAG: hypothetical protein LBV02_03965 [Bacteroidales bacterium]|jgi:hypothetical protein|nr:hypothetical protein [Bacteroidales bacterium]